MTLYDLFYNFHLSKNNDEISAKHFANHMVACLASTEIVVVAKNLDDGIGDCVSQFYFTKKLMRLLSKSPDIHMKAISYVSEKKNKLAEKIAQETFDKDQIFTLFSNEAAYKSQPIILGLPKEKSQMDLLSGILENADLVFNVAIGLHSVNHQVKICRMGHILDRAPEIVIPNRNNTFLASWVQYEYHSHTNPLLNDLYRKNYIEYKDASVIYTENAMGIHQNQMGLRFIDSIEEAITKNRQELLDTLKTERIISRHIPLKAENQSFAAGYLQSEDTTRAFVLLAAQTTPNAHGDMNAFVNIDFYDQPVTDLKNKNKIEKNTIFLNTLKELGYTHVEMITRFDQEPKVTILNPNTDTKKNRTLRLVRFAGINEKTKAALEAISEVVSGSGDTSVSEVITAGLKQNQTALPFFQQYATSESSCIQSILEEVDAWREGNAHQELHDYLEYLFRNNKLTSGDLFLGTLGSVNFAYDANRSDELAIKQNRSKIVVSWNKFCQYLFKHRNEAYHFNELIVFYAFHRLLVNNQLEIFKELSASLGKNAFKNETLLHLAVKLNCTDIAQYLIANNLCDINKTHSFNGYTALHMAVHQNNKDLTELLISIPSIDLYALDRGGNTPFLLSAITGNITIFNLLYKVAKPLEKELKVAYILAARNGYPLIIQQLKNFAEIDINDLEIKGALSKALQESVINEDIELATFLISLGTDVNYQEVPGHSLLYLAIKGHNGVLSPHAMHMVNLLLENNANPNTDVDLYNLLMCALMNKDIQLFEILLNHGAAIEDLLDRINYQDIFRAFGSDNRNRLLLILGDKHRKAALESMGEPVIIKSNESVAHRALVTHSLFKSYYDQDLLDFELICPAINPQTLISIIIMTIDNLKLYTAVKAASNQIDNGFLRAQAFIMTLVKNSDNPLFQALVLDAYCSKETNDFFITKGDMLTGIIMACKPYEEELANTASKFAWQNNFDLREYQKTILKLLSDKPKDFQESGVTPANCPFVQKNKDTMHQHNYRSS